MHRRTFNALLTSAAGAAALGRFGTLVAQQATARADFYANVGPKLVRYRVADDARSLNEVGDPVVLPEEVQEAYPWGRFLYVATSDAHTAAMANARTI